MQQSLPTSSQPEPENKCLGCLFMKLEGILVAPEQPTTSQLQPKSATTEQINLYLTIQFNEQRELLIGGRIQFGLKGGKLKIKLKNAEIALESRKLDGVIELFTQNQRQQQQGCEIQTSIKASLNGSQPIVKTNPDKNYAEGKTNKFQSSVCQVTTSDSNKDPTWVFEVIRDEPVLKGLLKNVFLTTLNVKAKPCCVEATFEVSPQDVYMTEAEGLWPENMSRTRITVIERAIARRFLEGKLKPYLSRHELQYD